MAHSVRARPCYCSQERTRAHSVENGFIYESGRKKLGFWSGGGGGGCRRVVKNIWTRGRVVNVITLSSRFNLHWTVFAFQLCTSYAHRWILKMHLYITSEICTEQNFDSLSLEKKTGRSKEGKKERKTNKSNVAIISFVTCKEKCAWPQLSVNSVFLSVSL